MEIKCVNGALGVEVCGVDLNNISAQTRDDLLSLYNQHLVLMFRARTKACGA